jgi:LacI family transcriptional regulator
MYFCIIYDDSVENFEIPFCIKEGIIAGIITLGRVSQKHSKNSHGFKTSTCYDRPLSMIIFYTIRALVLINVAVLLQSEHLINTGHKAIAFSGDINVSISF